MLNKIIIHLKKDKKEDDEPKKGGILPPYGYKNNIAV